MERPAGILVNSPGEGAGGVEGLGTMVSIVILGQVWGVSTTHPDLLEDSPRVSTANTGCPRVSTANGDTANVTLSRPSPPCSATIFRSHVETVQWVPAEDRCNCELHGPDRNCLRDCSPHYDMTSLLLNM